MSLLCSRQPHPPTNARGLLSISTIHACAFQWRLPLQTSHLILVHLHDGINGPATASVAIALQLQHPAPQRGVAAVAARYATTANHDAAAARLQSNQLKIGVAAGVHTPQRLRAPKAKQLAVVRRPAARQRTRERSWPAKLRSRTARQQAVRAVHVAPSQRLELRGHDRLRAEFGRERRRQRLDARLATHIHQAPTALQLVRGAATAAAAAKRPHSAAATAVVARRSGVSCRSRGAQRTCSAAAAASAATAVAPPLITMQRLRQPLDRAQRERQDRLLPGAALNEHALHVAPAPRHHARQLVDALRLMQEQRTDRIRIKRVECRGVLLRRLDERVDAPLLLVQIAPAPLCRQPHSPGGAARQPPITEATSEAPCAVVAAVFAAPAWRPVLQLRQQQLVAVQHVEQAVGVAG
mmetsp:Transcript_8045/g.24252  ORF Transcript_8045/g.24252 Transcript_8045/m.24252 type:complete len:411 (-) Transcript_8045:106-1338(-)